MKSTDICERTSLKRISVRRVMGAGKRKAISDSVNTSAARWCGTTHARTTPTASTNPKMNSQVSGVSPGKSDGAACRPSCINGRNERENISSR